MIRKKILVIDDDEGILGAFEAMLESGGYDVVVSQDATNVLELIKDHKPDLILLDVLLSGVDGRDICKALKSDDSTKKIPIIMVSAHPSATKSTKLAGAEDFLEKPFEMTKLFKKVEKLISP